MSEEDDLTLEEVYFGPSIGLKSVYQVRAVKFHEKCMEMNSSDSDSTGLRIYAGAQVATRFVSKHPELFEKKSVCELGCGVGVVGLCVSLSCDVSRVLLTDGNAPTVSIAARNIKHFGVESKASTEVLYWDPAMEEKMAASKFDVVMGFELMYYKLDLEALIGTMKSLVKENGIFFHAHIFRKQGLELEVIEKLETMGWTSLEVPLTSIVHKRELSQHADWFNVRCLISGSYQVIQSLSEEHPNWIPFQEAFPEDDCSDDDDEGSDTEFNSLFN
jgi:2-polyprenyl-3-methyl-5-hydroxy-6-metoxy-1,4-benzoquinol methylase